MTKHVHVYKNGKLLKHFTADLVDITPNSVVFFDVPLKHKGTWTGNEYTRGKTDVHYYGHVSFFATPGSCLLSLESGEVLVEINIAFAEEILIPSHN